MGESGAWSAVPGTEEVFRESLLNLNPKSLSLGRGVGGIVSYWPIRSASHKNWLAHTRVKVHVGPFSPLFKSFS